MSKSHLSEKIEQKKTFEQVSVRYIAPTDETFNRKMQLVSVDQGLWMKSERKEKPKRKLLFVVDAEFENPSTEDRVNFRRQYL